MIWCTLSFHAKQKFLNCFIAFGGIYVVLKLQENCKVQLLLSLQQLQFTFACHLKHDSESFVQTDDETQLMSHIYKRAACIPSH